MNFYQRFWAGITLEWNEKTFGRIFWAIALIMIISVIVLFVVSSLFPANLSFIYVLIDLGVLMGLSISVARGYGRWRTKLPEWREKEERKKRNGLIEGAWKIGKAKPELQPYFQPLIENKNFNKLEKWLSNYQDFVENEMIIDEWKDLCRQIPDLKKRSKALRTELFGPSQ